MDWASDEFAFTDNDFGLFQYEERESIVLHRSASEEKPTKQTLNSDHDWIEWIKTKFEPVSGKQANVCVVLCSRADSLSEDEASPVSYLPFSRHIFDKITDKFRIHRTIARTVSREGAYFSCTAMRDPDMMEQCNVLTYRASATWCDDVAMAATYFPEFRTTFAIVFGCNRAQQRQIEGRIALVEPAALAHPLLLPGILAELERKRLTGLVEDTLDKFTLRAGGSSSLVDGHVGALHMSEEQMGEYLELCYESQNIAKEFRFVKRQLAKMAEACDEFGISAHAVSEMRSSEATLWDDDDGFANVGRRIKKRTLEIMDEYDNKIDECGMVLENMSITMQTIWNHIARNDASVNTRISKANTSIALDSKQENAQMRSIALLTMIYLPFSAVASIFSMTLFNWDPPDGTIVSNYIWIFVVVSVGLTLLTVGIWQFATYKQKRKTSRYEDLEIGLGNVSGTTPSSRSW